MAGPAPIAADFGLSVGQPPVLVDPDGAARDVTAVLVVACLRLYAAGRTVVGAARHAARARR